MAGLRELKSRLSSINTVGQLAGAMRTVSAAKYSRISNVRNGFSPYAEACREMMEEFGSALAEAMPCGDPQAPPCYVVIAGNRGLCGGYNSELTIYATKVLRELETPYVLVTLGKKAEAAMKDSGFAIERAFEIPDVPDFDACRELLDYLREGYLEGSFSSLWIIHQKFINMLTREAVTAQILPMSFEPVEQKAQELFVPDKETVLKSAVLRCFDSVVYSTVLEAAAGAQAATLVAMRSAYDNAQESIADLETEISRKRQSEVTAGVLETASDFME